LLITEPVAVAAEFFPVGDVARSQTRERFWILDIG
jgi:hypothetical protein